jgi:CxxC motif-containing protein (DUF1111 family)
VRHAIYPDEVERRTRDRFRNTINDHTFFLHDGRARGFAEAILWHGGEASVAKEAFRKLEKADREDLIGFLRSL